MIASILRVFGDFSEYPGPTIVGNTFFQSGEQVNIESDALHVLTNRTATERQIAGIAADILATPGVLGPHELKTRKAGDKILGDIHMEIDGGLTVVEGHYMLLRGSD